MKCVVVALSEDIRNLMAASLQSLEVKAVLLPSLGELVATLKTIPVSGILMELTTAIKASPHEKITTQEPIQLYPSTKFRVVDDKIFILGNQSALDRFIVECRQFQPRRIRTSPRVTKYLAVYLSENDSFDDPEKVITTNISERGCFVYSTREWKLGTCVYLRFAGSDMVSRCKVRWSQPWGNSKIIPGIGLEFQTSETTGSILREALKETPAT